MVRAETTQRQLWEQMASPWNLWRAHLIVHCGNLWNHTGLCLQLFCELRKISFPPWASVSPPRDEGVGSYRQVLSSANTQFSQVILFCGSGARLPVFECGHCHVLTTLSQSYLLPLSLCLLIRKMGIRPALEGNCKNQVRYPIAEEATGPVPDT